MRTKIKTAGTCLGAIAIAAIAWIAAAPSSAPPAIFQHAGEMRGASCIQIDLGTYVIATVGSPHFANGCDTILTLSCGGGTTCRSTMTTAGAVAIPIVGSTPLPGAFTNGTGICQSCCPLYGLEGGCGGTPTSINLGAFATPFDCN